MVKMLPFLKDLSIRELLKVGAHFGHKVSHMHPRMLPYIHSKKSAVHIIDIRKTVKGLIDGCYFLTEQSKKDLQILFVGTKRQLRAVVENLAKQAGVHYVTERWPGGLLTNFQTISTSIRKLEKIQAMEEGDQLKKLTKKEKACLDREKKRLLRNLGGILNLKKTPDIMVVVDPDLEHNAVQEARKMGITLIGLVDTDTDPGVVDIVIPCNDDSLNVVHYILKYLTDAIIYGKRRVTPSEKEQVSTASEV